MQMVGFHLFNLIFCGMILMLFALAAFLVYFIVSAKSRRRNIS
jgi:hypothetical protein